MSHTALLLLESTSLNFVSIGSDSARRNNQQYEDAIRRGQRFASQDEYTSYSRNYQYNRNIRPHSDVSAYNSVSVIYL